jgi:cell division inhibitor SulA
MDAHTNVVPPSALVWRGDTLIPARDGLPTGFAELDALLPGGGWPQGALTELLSDGEGIGELGVLMPALSELTKAGQWVAFIAPPYVPYAPALVRLGMNLNHLIILEAKSLKDQCWATEQALRGGCLSAVVFWPHTLDERGLRRLQLAAQTGGAAGFVFVDATRALQSSPAPLRLKLAAAEQRLSVHVLKRRGSLVSTPLSINVAAAAASLFERSDRSAEKKPPYQEINLRSRKTGPRLSKQHANGVQDGKIWDTVMSRNDTVKGSAGDGR